ncbi:MAG: Rpn family recombination-promoting nuclease/putative transposase [Planctomycetes bacterium]|nr:Rpn family recombination-promoting nuclease/putative transposase [Planctomycetota bacterium]
MARGERRERGGDTPLVRACLDRELKQLLAWPEHLRALVRLASPTLAGKLDFDRRTLLPGRFTFAGLRQKTSDLLVRVPYRPPATRGWRGPTAVPAHLLFEHQSSPSATVPLRLLRCMTRRWESELSAAGRRRRSQSRSGHSRGRGPCSRFVPLVLYTGLRPWPRGPSLRDLIAAPPGLDEFVPSGTILFVDLARTAGAALLRAERYFGLVLQVLAARAVAPPQFAEIVRAAVAGLAPLARRRPRRWRRLRRSLTRICLFYRAPNEHDILLDVLKAAAEPACTRSEVEQMATTIAEYLIRKGMVRGKARGLAEGKAEGEAKGRVEGEALGKAKALLRVLDRRFGRVPRALRTRVAGVTDLPELDRLLDLAVEVSSLKEFSVEA